MKHQKNKEMIEYSDSWSSKNAVDFYTIRRNSLKEVYKSEQHFLSSCIRPGQSILDVGCAVGGFSNIFSTLELQTTYTGIDISPEMILKAHKIHNNIPFFIGDAGDLPFKNGSFDLVYCSGAIHMSLNWMRMISECWRVTRDLFIFDVRLIENGTSIEDISKSFEKIAFDNQWDGKSIVPYIILNHRDLMSCLRQLSPVPELMHFFGYYHPVSKMTTSSVEQVCMTMCCLGKKTKSGKDFIWDLPIKLQD